MSKPDCPGSCKDRGDVIESNIPILMKDGEWMDMAGWLCEGCATLFLWQYDHPEIDRYRQVNSVHKGGVR